MENTDETTNQPVTVARNPNAKAIMKARQAAINELVANHRDEYVDICAKHGYVKARKIPAQIAVQSQSPIASPTPDSSSVALNPNAHQDAAAAN